MAEKDDPSKSPIATKIEALGDRGDQILGAAQSTVSKLGKRLLQIIGAIAVGSVLFYQAISTFQEKTKDIFRKNGVEKVEVKEGSSVFKVKGRSDLSNKAEPRSQPEK